jgi:hypothetical protein
MTLGGRVVILGHSPAGTVNRPGVKVAGVDTNDLPWRTEHAE